MSTPMKPRNQSRRRVIARSSTGQVIYATKVHDPAQNMIKGWNRTGTSLRGAMDTYKRTIR